MNLLILSCGTRNKLVRYFKENRALIGKVVGTDCSEQAPALYETDSHYIVPRMKEPGYLQVILDICKKEQIDAVLPLQEDELYLISCNRELFTQKGITPIISDADSIELCRDKYAFYKHMKAQGIPVMMTCNGYQDFLECYARKEIAFPVFAKPCRGAGSVGISKVEHQELLEVLCKYSEEEMIIQQFADGEEYGVDVYVDMISRRPTAIFTKKKLRMRAGETEKSVSVKDEKLFALVEKTAAAFDLAGPIDMDVFCVDGEYYISEINPRFGGGYPHAYECGVKFPEYIANNIAGKENPVTIGEYQEGVVMLKYTDLLILK